jgi:hypothetical protein
LEKGGRQRKGERELGREGFGEEEFNKKKKLITNLDLLSR